MTRPSGSSAAWIEIRGQSTRSDQAPPSLLEGFVPVPAEGVVAPPVAGAVPAVASVAGMAGTAGAAAGAGPAEAGDAAGAPGSRTGELADPGDAARGVFGEAVTGAAGEPVGSEEDPAPPPQATVPASRTRSPHR